MEEKKERAKGNKERKGENFREKEGREKKNERE